MTTVSLSVAFVPYRPLAETPAARDAAPPAAVAKSAQTAMAPSCSTGDCDTPRRSPLFRALMEALDSVVGSAKAPGMKAEYSTAQAAAAAPATPSVANVDEITDAAATAVKPESLSAKAPVDDKPVDLEQAVMSFARALMQVMRGAQHSDGGGKGEGDGHRIHRHRHHEHMAWGDPAQRVEQLGVQIGAAAPAKAPAAEVKATSDAPAVVVDHDAVVASDAAEVAPDSAAVLDPAQTITLAGSSAQSTMLYVKLSIDDLAPWASSATRAEQSLLNAFGTLQKALGMAATDDRPSLKEQLSAFLQALAEKLRTGEVDSFDATQPGALLHVTA